MTRPERKRNELKLDFDLEKKNAIKKQGRKFNKTEKKFSFFSFITCNNIATYLQMSCTYSILNPTYILTLDHQQKFEWTDIFSSQCLEVLEL